MYIDSHCHLDKLDLKPYAGDFSALMQDTLQQGVKHMLCISIGLAAYPAMRELTAPYPQISLSLGVHPNVTDEPEASIDELLALAADERVIAIGETGLDYFHSQGDLSWQRERFIRHIEVAKTLGKPLVIHTRDAGQDALDVLQAHAAEQVGGIIHCFTEDWEYAQRAMDLNFYVSFSGIVTFKNAQKIQEVAQKIPADRFLIETDAPYLAPTPYRGKPNYPAYVRYAAEFIAGLRGTDAAEVARLSSENFYRLFPTVQA
jgi:TatD DNase family protein